jgi:hypothetical protein
MLYVKRKAIILKMEVQNFDMADTDICYVM